jgi:hypothetical protein
MIFSIRVEHAIYYATDEVNRNAVNLYNKYSYNNL